MSAGERIEEAICAATRQGGGPALVAYLTAGFPRRESFRDHVARELTWMYEPVQVSYRDGLHREYPAAGMVCASAQPSPARRPTVPRAHRRARRLVVV